MTALKGQLQLLDGAVLRDKAIKQAEDNAKANWLASAFSAVRQCAALKDRFTTDDVWSLVGQDGTHEPRAMGAVMMKAARAGIARPTNTTRQSRRPVCHRRPVTIWQSLVYQGKEESLT